MGEAQQRRGPPRPRVPLRDVGEQQGKGDVDGLGEGRQEADGLGGDAEPEVQRLQDGGGHERAGSREKGVPAPEQHKRRQKPPNNTVGLK